MSRSQRQIIYAWILFFVVFHILWFSFVLWAILWCDGKFYMGIFSLHVSLNYHITTIPLLFKYLDYSNTVQHIYIIHWCIDIYFVYRVHALYKTVKKQNNNIDSIPFLSPPGIRLERFFVLTVGFWRIPESWLVTRECGYPIKKRATRSRDRFFF